MKHETSILRFMGHKDVTFTDTAVEQTIRMGRVKIKVSGCAPPIQRTEMVPDIKLPQVDGETRT